MAAPSSQSHSSSRSNFGIVVVAADEKEVPPPVPPPPTDSTLQPARSNAGGAGVWVMVKFLKYNGDKDLPPLLLVKVPPKKDLVAKGYVLLEMPDGLLANNVIRKITELMHIALPQYKGSFKPQVFYNDVNVMIQSLQNSLPLTDKYSLLPLVVYARLTSDYNAPAELPRGKRKLTEGYGKNDAESSSDESNGGSPPRKKAKKKN